MSGMKYAMIGSGAMGYRYGVLLQEAAGIHVDFIGAWDENVNKVREQGGVMVSRDHGNRHLVPIRMYTPEDYDGSPDVWIVFVKQMQLADMLQRCKHLFRNHQTVFSAMNGWGHLEKLQQYFPDGRIYGGTTLTATVLNGPGDIDFIGKAGIGAMNMCVLDEQVSGVGLIMRDDFKAAGLDPTITEDFKGTCMAEVVFNSVINTLCTMYQIQMGRFVSYPGAMDMARQPINEAYDVCDRAGIRIVNTRRQELEAINYVSRVACPLHYPPMYQDTSRGRETEVDYVNGYIAELGRNNDYVCHMREFLTHGVYLAELAFKLHHQQ